MLKVVRNALLALVWALAPMATAQSDDPALPGPLTDQPGDPERGLAILRDSGLPSCMICHLFPALPDKDQGGLGPVLDGVVLGAYAPAELRLRIIDARRIVPDTIMPPYFSTEGLFRVAPRWAGQTIYSAQDVEDVIAFLQTLAEK